jgi:hypothetical protein
MTTNLLESTGSLIADKILQGVIGILEQVFPDRVRGYFVRGSYASATSTEGSDLDMFVVFKDAFVEPAEAKKARDICGHCALLSPILLEILVVSERQLQRQANLVIALQLKLASRPAYGQDIRPQLPDFQADAYVRSVVDAPYFNYTYPPQRRSSPHLTYPLGHIDPEGAFYGFDQWLIPGPDGADIPSTKLLVATVGWTATALIALATGRYVRNKSACVDLYREHVADQWTELVVGVYELCRNQWHYHIPAAEEDRHQLRALCVEALAFQNHFLSRYRTYLLDELHSAAPDRQSLAAQRLAQIRYPDSEVVEALHQLRDVDDADLRRAVETALDRYPPEVDDTPHDLHATGEQPLNEADDARRPAGSYREHGEQRSGGH